MAPKIKTTREDIIKTAVEMVKTSGADVLGARALAGILGCSTQPIFSNFQTMDDLRLAVVYEADRLCEEYMKREMESGEYPPYKATGMAYIRFAKEEKELFKLLYMRDRANEKIPNTTGFGDEIELMVQDNTGLKGQDARLFHLEMWAYVHGIATMFATGFLDLDWALVSKMITDCYQGLKKQYGME